MAEPRDVGPRPEPDMDAATPKSGRAEEVPGVGIPRTLDDVLRELTEDEPKLRRAISEVVEKHEDAALAARQAEWHVRGLIYHGSRMVEHYRTFAKGVTGRALASSPGPDALIMHAPEFQLLLFEFYGLVTLGRIAADNLVRFVRPLFADPSHLPKSIRDIPLGSTDCPVLAVASQTSHLEYLCDLRDCLVHFRPFATSEGAVVLREGADENGLPQDLAEGPWLGPMARAVYRYVDSGGVSVNVFLPDQVFERDGRGKRLSEFLYGKRRNIIGFARDIVQSLAFLTHGAVHVQLNRPGKPYTFDKKRPFHFDKLAAPQPY